MNPHMNMPAPSARQALLEILVEAALSGHDLTPVDPVPSGGYQSRCRRCGQTAWVGGGGLQYSLLAVACPRQAA
jgi:hypothetical protein